MITLKKLAELANVSVSTVSRALNDGFDIAPDTREMILQLARENGYFLEKKRIRTENRKKIRFQIAILCPEINSGFYADLVAKLAASFHEEHCNCIVYHTGFDHDFMNELFAACIDRSDIDAIISLGNISHFPQNPTVPMVMPPSAANPNASLLHYDIHNAIHAILEAIEAEHLSRIAFVSEPHTQSKLSYFTEQAAARNLTIEPFLSNKRFDAAGRQAAEHFAAMEKRPELIICAYDEIACGLIEGLQNRGIRVPEDVRVMGWNDISTARYCFSGLTTIHYDIDKVIPQIIADLLRDKKSGVISKKIYTVSSQLIRRNTF